MNMMKNDQPNSEITSGANSNPNNNKIVNASDYQGAIGLTGKAQEIFNRIIKTKALSNKAPSIATLESSLAQLKSAIDAKQPYSDVIIIIHTKVHPAIVNAFNLKLA